MFLKKNYRLKIEACEETMAFKFDQKFIMLFFHWGLVVHRWRCLFFCAPLLLSGGLAFGFLWIQEQVSEAENSPMLPRRHVLQTSRDPQYVFSPEDAKWRYERAVLKERWPLNEGKFWPGKSYVESDGLFYPKRLTNN